MADSPRIEDLRRRVQKDPASIAFAQLAEECRRAGQFQEAVEACQAGLAIHPGYLSARVTLGRSLIELDQLDEAQLELQLVLSTAPENLAAIRGLAEIYHRRGSLHEALRQYRAALALARNDPDLERTVTELARAIEPKPPAPVFDGLSFEEMANEFMKNSPPPPPPAAIPDPVSDTGSDTGSDTVSDPGLDTVSDEVSDTVSDTVSDPVPDTVPVAPVHDTAAAFPADLTPSKEEAAPSSIEPETVASGVVLSVDPPAAAESAPPSPLDVSGASAGQVPPSPSSDVAPASAEPWPPTADEAAPPVEDATRVHAQARIAALDQWLDAIHVARAQRST